MDEQIKQIAERLRGLRDVLELTAEDIARECDISPYDYRLAETGDFDSCRKRRQHRTYQGLQISSPRFWFHEP